MLRRPFVFAALAAVFLLLVLSSPALAHSRLVSSNPTSGARLNAAPASVVMQFSEGAQPEFSLFAVIDRARKHYELAIQPAIDKASGQVTVALQPAMPPGAYTVQWKVVSVVDGHLTRGSFVFTVLGAAATMTATPAPAVTVTPTAAAVGNTTPTAATPGNITPALTVEPPTATLTVVPPTPEPTEVLPVSDETDQGSTQESQTPGAGDIFVRWLGYLLAAVVIGGAAFALLVVPAALARLSEHNEIGPQLDRRFAAAALAAGVLLLLTLAAEIVLQGARAAETSPINVLFRPDILTAVLGSSFGLAILLRMLALIAIAALLTVGLVTRRLGRPLLAGIVILGAGYYIAQNLSGHALAISKQAGAGVLQTLAPFADVIHLLATGFWIGGIFYFVVVLLPLLKGVPADARARFLGGGVASFSKVAITSVVLLIVSGLINFLAEQPSVESTLNTDYGRAVLIKVGLLALLAVPALYNLRRVGPVLDKLRGKSSDTGGQLVSGFRISIRVEALLIALVLVFSAILTLSAPATDTGAAAQPTAEPTSLAAVTATTVAQEPPTVAQEPPTDVATQPVIAPTWPPTLPPTSAPLTSSVTLSETIRDVHVTLDTIHADNDYFTVHLSDAKGPIKACLPTPAPDDDCVLDFKINLTQLEDRTTDVLVGDDQGGDGAFTIFEAPYLSLDGNYQLVVVVRRYNQPEDIQAAFHLALAGSSLTGAPSDYVRVKVQTDPAPPRSGPVKLVFDLADSTGKPIEDATITIVGIMPVHGHVTEDTAITHTTGGQYSGILLMPMQGGWNVELDIERPGGNLIVAEVSLDLAESEYDLTPIPSPNVKP